MISETVVSAFLEASLTGMGLVLAVYALLTPASEDIFEQRAKMLKESIDSFNEEQAKLTDASSDDVWKRHEQKRKEINKTKVLPMSFDFGIIVAFTFFAMSFFTDILWLATPEVYHNSSNELAVFVFVILGWISFALVGISILLEIAGSLRRKFEGIKEKQKAIKKLKSIKYKGKRYVRKSQSDASI